MDREAHYDGQCRGIYTSSGKYVAHQDSQSTAPQEVHDNAYEYIQKYAEEHYCGRSKCRTIDNASRKVFNLTVKELTVYNENYKKKMYKLKNNLVKHFCWKDAFLTTIQLKLILTKARQQR